jgi:hypothetical protein
MRGDRADSNRPIDNLRPEGPFEGTPRSMDEFNLLDVIGLMLRDHKIT